MFFKSAPQYEELALHTVITDGPGGQEVLRAWNMNDGHQVFLVKPDAFEDPFIWGMNLVDAMKHIAGAIGEGDPTREQQAFHRVLEGFMAELQNPTDQPETVAHQ